MRLLLFLSLLIVAACASQPGDERDQVGRIQMVDGSAFVLRGERMLAAGDRMRLFADDVLVTGPDSTATIGFEDKSRLFVDPDSRLDLPVQSKDTTRLVLQAGGVRFERNRQVTLSVTAPQATVSVTGRQRQGEFWLGLSGNGEDLLVIQLAEVPVRIANAFGESIASEPGEGVEVGFARAPSEPRMLPPERVARRVQRARFD